MAIVITHPSTTKKLIVDLLHLDEDRLHLQVYEVGLQFLDKYFGRDEKAIDFFARSKTFWNWWKNAWSRRDQVFIESLKADELPLSPRLQLYATFNNALTLASELSIPSVIYKSFSTIVNARL